MKNVEVPSQHLVHAPAALAVSGPVVSPVLLSGRRCRSKYAWVVQVALGRHDSVSAGCSQTLINVSILEDVSVCEYDRIWRQVVAQVADSFPVCQPGVVSLLMSLPTMNSNDARSRV